MANDLEAAEKFLRKGDPIRLYFDTVAKRMVAYAEQVAQERLEEIAAAKQIPRLDEIDKETRKRLVSAIETGYSTWATSDTKAGPEYIADAIIASGLLDKQEEPKRDDALMTKIASAYAHRACCGDEQDPLNGKLHGYCVVCGVPWPCETAKSFLVEEKNRPANPEEAPE